MSAVGVTQDLPNHTKGNKGKKENAARPSVPALKSGGQATDRSSSVDGIDGESHGTDSPYIKELQRNVRNVTKKLTAMQKVDSIIAENPNMTLDDLVATRKINNDQKAQALKKPGLQSSLTQLEEQIVQYRKYEEDSQQRFSAERQKIEEAHQEQLEQLRTTVKAEVEGGKSKELKQQLLVISRFLRAAAARRQTEDDESDETKAFEGMLLLLYGGDASAVDAAQKLIDGANEGVPSTEGPILSVTYNKVKTLSLEYAPFEAEAEWANDVARAEHAAPAAGGTAVMPSTDPTIAHAGMTELAGITAMSGGHAGEAEQAPLASLGNIDAGASNAVASQQWDNNNSSTDPMAESWVSVPRDPAETENAPVAAAANATSSWADDVPTEPLVSSITNGNDGFHEVHHGHRGGRGRGEHRGGRGRGGPRGDGFRGRGGFRGDRGGEGGIRGRGRGRGRGDARGRGGEA